MVTALRLGNTAFRSPAMLSAIWIRRSSPPVLVRRTCMVATLCLGSTAFRRSAMLSALWVRRTVADAGRVATVLVSRLRTERGLVLRRTQHRRG